MTAFSDPAFYGDRWADVYDQRHADLDAAATAEFLAGQAGLRLRERYGDWYRRPFDSASRQHVSVYQRA